MRKKERVIEAVRLLEKLYPDAVCSLEYKDPFQLLIATRLSAQCTDARVNLVTPALFAEFPTAEKMAKAPISRIEELIKTCGLYKTKAKDLIEIGKGITERFGGKVPDTIEELTTLSGVGRKTANLVLALGFNKPAICVDVHVHRICNRLGYIQTKTPEETEFALREKLPQKHWLAINTILVTHGQNVCKPTKPNCEACPISEYCKKVW